MDPRTLSKLAHVRTTSAESSTTPGQQTSSDVPLKLESTTQWTTSEPVYLADVIAELVGLTLSLAPENPFAVDHGYLDGLPLEESVLLSGALVEFLSGIWTRGGPFAEKSGLPSISSLFCPWLIVAHFPSLAGSASPAQPTYERIF
jgi:hypothetical protein